MPAVTDDELFGIIQGPDFPTGGIMMGRAGAYKAHTTGRGSVIVRAKTHFEDLKDRHAIIIDEIPYQVNKAQLIIKNCRAGKRKNALKESAKFATRPVKKAFALLLN